MDYPVKGTPKTHQLEALKEADLKTGHCYWMDPGAGKTYTTIAEAGVLFQKGEIDGVLIVAPNGPHRQWVEEQFPLWADFDYHSVHNKQPDGVQKVFFNMARRGLAVAAINFEALGAGKKGKAFVANFMKLYPRILLVIDESQKIKDPKSNRSKTIYGISQQAKYRRALSGTPLLNGLQDLFMQYHCVAPGVTGFRSFTAFKNHYCIQRPIPGARSRFAMQIVGYQNEDELKERTRPVATRTTADQFMTGQPPVMSKVWVPMSDDKKWTAAYKEMKDDLMLELEGDSVEVDNALTQLGKLMQIACGFYYNKAGDAVWLSTARVEAAVEIVEGLREPVILWTPYTALTEAVTASVIDMGRPVFFKDDVEAWKTSTDGVLIGNQSSGLGVGMNLQHAASAIYLGNTFSAEHRWQSIKRIDRIGQERQVRIWDMICPGTVDEKVLGALSDKKTMSIRNIDTLKRLIGDTQNAEPV